MYQGGFTYLRDYEAADPETGLRYAPSAAPILHDEHGNPRVATVNKKSDAALMFLLKGRRKKVFAERTEITGANGGVLQIDEGARASRVAQLLALAKTRAQQLTDDLEKLA